MKVLAAVTFVFMPLTFVTSVYGMNFDGMHETKWPGAFYVLLFLLAVAALVMHVWLRRHGWTEIERVEEE